MYHIEKTCPIHSPTIYLTSTLQMHWFLTLHHGKSTLKSNHLQACLQSRNVPSPNNILIHVHTSQSQNCLTTNSNFHLHYKYYQCTLNSLILLCIYSAVFTWGKEARGGLCLFLLCHLLTSGCRGDLLLLLGVDWPSCRSSESSYCSRGARPAEIDKRGLFSSHNLGKLLHLDGPPVD